MANEDERKLFVAGLPDSVTEDVLRQVFEATGGTVTDVSLPRDRMTGRPRGFGFVTLGTAEQAEQARRALDGSMQAGRSISVRTFQSEAPRRDGPPRGQDRGDARGEGFPRVHDQGEGRGPERSDGASRGFSGERAGFGGGADRGADRTLYVGNLPYDCSVADIEALFEARGAGRPARVHLPAGPDGRPRGFGFVAMSTPEAANEAILALRDADMGGRRLMINLAHPRGERPERAERPDREYRPPREPGSLPPRAPSPSMPPPGAPPFVDPAKAEGRRRGDRPDKKKKRGTGGGEGDAARPKRGREKNRDWNDWDKE